MTFRPDWISAPGETINDILEQRNMSRSDLADHLGGSPEQVADLVNGGRTITAEIAQRLEKVLGAPASFWINRERQFREGLAALANKAKEPLTTSWLNDLPIADMVSLGWIPKSQDRVEQFTSCLRFFGVSDVPSWQSAYGNLLENATFRTSTSLTSRPGSVAAWMRRGELEGAEIICKPWSATHFKNILQEVRPLTREKDPQVFVPLLQKTLSECGVAVVVLRAPKGCRASGVTRFPSTNRALMLLSFRFLSDDQFWFSVFHEAGHLLLHSSSSIFVDGPDTPSTGLEEEANEFAADALIPGIYREEMLSLPRNGREVMRFARKVGISPGVVVGQLQHQGRLERQQLNNLKRRYEWQF